MENLPILQDFVPYWGRWPAFPYEIWEKVKQGKGTADYLMPFSYLSSLNPPHPWQGALYWQSGTPIAPFQRKVLRTIRPTPKRPCSKHFQILLSFSIDYLIILEVFVVLFARWRGLYPDPNWFTSAPCLMSRFTIGNKPFPAAMISGDLLRKV